MARSKVTSTKLGDWLPHAWVLILLLTLLGYAPTLLYPFVWDDYAFVVDNPAVIELNSPLAYFSERTTLGAIADYHHAIYRPLRTWVYALLYSQVGDEPFTFHLLNLLLHAGCAIWLWRLALRLGMSDGAALLGALIFALHPLQTEAVTWVSSLGDLLYAFVYLAAFYLWVGARSWQSRLAVVGLAALSYLSKEMAVTLPLTIATYEAWRWLSSRHPKPMPWGWLTLLLVEVGAYLGLRYAVLQASAQSPVSMSSIAQALIRLPTIAVTYLKLWLIPYPQNAFYPLLGRVDPSAFTFWLSFTVVIVAVLATMRLWRTKQLAGLFFTCAGISLIPVLNFLPVWSQIAERFSYLALGWFAMGGVALGQSLWQRLKAKNKIWVVRWGAVMLLIVLATLTCLRNQVWQSDLAIAEDNVRKAPSHEAALWNLGTAALRQASYEKAVSAFERLRALQPQTDVRLLYNLTAAYLGQRHVTAAVGVAKEAVALHPELNESQANLAIAMIHQGDFTAAIARLNAIVRHSPNHLLARVSRGKAFYLAGEKDAAEADFRKVLELSERHLLARLWLIRLCHETHRELEGEQLLQELRLQHRQFAKVSLADVFNVVDAGL